MKTFKYVVIKRPWVIKAFKLPWGGTSMYMGPQVTMRYVTNWWIVALIVRLRNPGSKMGKGSFSPNQKQD